MVMPTLARDFEGFERACARRKKSGGLFDLFYFSGLSLAGFASPSSNRDATSFFGCPTLRF
jgi:hypothetical protein